MTVLASIGLTLLCGGAFRLATAVWAAGIAVAWARVFLGVHFPLDMVGAIAVASAAYMVISPLWRRIGDAITGVAEQMYHTALAHPIAAGWIRR
jgi:undecaprenyl-diphosphatase